MKKNPAFNSLAVRTLSGIVIAAVVAGSVLLSPYTLFALLLVICAGGMKEFYQIAKLAGSDPQKWLGTGVGMVTVLIFGSGLFTSQWHGIGLAAIIALLFVVFLSELYRRREKPLLNIAVTLAGILYIAFPFSLLGYIGAGDWPYTSYVIMGYIVLVWANDVGAYLVGVAFGRQKLFERVSPKKSWEGFFGGLLLSVAVGVLIGWWLVGHHYSETSLVIWAGLAVVVVVSGVFGDLVESLLKRSVMIKDSGDVIPGHGGFLDRFDALLFSVPFVYLYFVIFAL